MKRKPLAIGKPPSSLLKCDRLDFSTCLFPGWLVPNKYVHISISVMVSEEHWMLLS